MSDRSVLTGGGARGGEREGGREGGGEGRERERERERGRDRGQKEVGHTACRQRRELTRVTRGESMLAADLLRQRMMKHIHLQLLSIILVSSWYLATTAAITGHSWEEGRDGGREGAPEGGREERRKSEM